jgi:proteasome lid subunit RPN8/RPN11
MDESGLLDGRLSLSGGRTMPKLILTQNQWETMCAHVESCRPLEGCGLLAGKGDLVAEVLLMANQAQSRTIFRMDPVEQIRAFRWLEVNGLDLVGIYHSHPAGPETSVPRSNGPSATDIAEATYPAVNLIWARPDAVWRAGGYWIENGHAWEVELTIGRGE